VDSRTRRCGKHGNSHALRIFDAGNVSSQTFRIIELGGEIRIDDPLMAFEDKTMFTKREINQAIEDEQRTENEYFKGILDFVKWTSAIATAALLWVGNSVASFSGLPRVIAFVGLLFFILSIAIAIITIRQVLAAWARRWNVAQEASYLLQAWNPVALRKANELENKYGHMSPMEYFTEMTKAGESYPSAQLVIEELKQLEPLIKAIEANVPYTRQARFGTWVSVHVVLLLVGLILYVTAQILGTL